MAVAFQVAHKCLVPVGGTPMLVRVIEALQACKHIGGITVSTDDINTAKAALTNFTNVVYVKSAGNAPGSVVKALETSSTRWPVLVTTADHALLTEEMLDHFLFQSAQSGADLTVGLAPRETIVAALPNTRRTYLKFSNIQVSGCNLFALNGKKALSFVRFWEQADKNRKKPWKLIGAFGVVPLVYWLSGNLTLETAFSIASQKLGANARPVLMPFAEAAVDVDKPEDKALVDELLESRG